MRSLAAFLRPLRPAARAAVSVAASVAALFAVAPAQAQYALAVSPPRFELSTRPGEPAREVLELTHSDSKAGAYKFKTADWSFRPDGSVVFGDELAEGSCRPWVAIERRDLLIAPGRPYRYRFEVAPPPDAKPQECRFAIMIEGQQPAQAPGMPIGLGARIGVIVYVAVGNVAPKLELAGSGVENVDGKPAAALRIRNTGDAHGRLGGFVTGTDAAGTRVELQPASTPILPGETRTVTLVANRPGSPEVPVAVKFPLQVSGKLDWGKDASLPLDLRIAQ